MPELTRPIVRYHGGKWRLAPWVISHFPDHRVYVEPFGGGGSVLLRKQRSYAEVYNDLDGEIVNVFRMARDHGQELARRLHLTPFSRDEFDLSYEPDGDPIEQARRTIARCMMGFGSSAMNPIHKTGFRANSNRSGTTPAHDWANYSAAFMPIIDRLRGVVIENRCALDIIAHQDSAEALHYIDPPYVHSARSWVIKADKAAYRHEMTDGQHRQLADLLHSVEGMVIISGYPSALYDELYRGWACIPRTAYADGARERTECLWINPAAANAGATSDLMAEVMR